MENKSTAERRHHPRRKAKWPVTMRRQCGSVHEVHTLDVSETGVLLATPIKLDMNEKVILNINAYFDARHFNVTSLGECRFVSLSGDTYCCGILLDYLSTPEKNTFRQFAKNGRTNKINPKLELPSPSERINASSS